MTRQSIQEYAQAIRGRYWQATKEGKTKILDEFTKTTGLHRSAKEKRDLKDTFKRLSPIKLLKQINENLEMLWNMADKKTD